MLKSGLIVGAITLFLALGVTLLVPYCVPCLALFVGLGAGYLAGIFDKPTDRQSALKNGAIAGAIGGAGALLGEMIGAVINGFMVGPDKAVQAIRSLGLPVDPTFYTPQTYWASTIGLNCCIGVFSVVLMAGLGLLGGMLWWSMTGSKSGAPTPPPPAFPLS